MDNIKIAKELIKLAKELSGSSVPMKEENINEHIDNALDDGWDYFVEELINYRDSIQNTLKVYGDKKQNDLNLIQSLYNNIMQKLNLDKDAKLTTTEKDILTQYNILSPILPSIGTKNAQEIRRKCEILMNQKVKELFNAFSQLVAREEDVNTMCEKLVEQINEIINDNGFKIYVRKSKQGNQKKMVKAFFQAAKNRGRVKNASSGIEVLRKNLVVYLTNLEGEIIAYDSVSNAYVQTLEALASEYATMDLMEKWMEKGYEYDAQRQVWYDPKSGDIIKEVKKIKTPQKISSIKNASIMDWLKSIGNKIKNYTKKLISKGREILSSLVDMKKKTEKDSLKSEEYVNDVKQELMEFNQFIEQLKNID